MVEWHDTVIIGGGQAGLVMSHHLRQRAREHVVLERRRVAERWRSERWNSLCFQFPNWSVALPSMPYASDDPDGFAHHSSILRFVEDYAAKIAAPVRQDTEVTALRQNSETGGYVIETPHGTLAAQRVVIATGPFQRPLIPDFGKNLPPTVHQVDATHYRSPGDLPSGAVLVVGSGASGCQIAEELYQAGRTVYFSISRHRRVPRRYRGKDVTWWFEKMGRFDVTVDSFPGRKYPPSVVVTGVGSGHDVDVRRYAQDGVTVLGHVQGISDGTLALAEDANHLLGEADKACADFISAAADFANASEWGFALDADDGMPPPAGPADIDGVLTLNLRAAGIRSVVWASGYRFDYGWAHLPVFDPHGAPIQQRGVTSCPGAYFLGLHWMHSFKSGLLSFVGEDAAYIADHMDAVTPA